MRSTPAASHRTILQRAALAALLAAASCSGGGSSVNASPPTATPVPGATPTPTPTPSATPTATPAGPAGAWILGNNRDATPRLKHVDANAAVVAEISGANANFNRPAGLDADASGNVYVFEINPFDAQISPNLTARIDVFGPSQSGNVAPIRSTFVASTITGVGGIYVGFTLDGAGNGYFLDTELSFACTIYRVATTGTTATATAVGDCMGIIGPDTRDIVSLHYDIARNRIYIESVGGRRIPPVQAVARYDRQPDGTFALFGKMTLTAPTTMTTGDIAIDHAGNVLVTTDQLSVFPASDFVAGQNTSPPRSDAYPALAPATVDPAGNIFAADMPAAAGIVVIPSGSHTVSARNPFNALFMAPVIGGH